MSWNETQTSTSVISPDEWNTMVTVIEAKYTEGDDLTAGVLVASTSFSSPGADFTGYLDLNDNYIRDIKIATFNSEVDNGTASSTETINWNSGQKQKSTLGADTTFTFTAPTNGVGNFVLKAVNFGAFTPTWPASVKWAGGTEPSWTASGTDIISFYYDGTNYYGAASLDFS